MLVASDDGSLHHVALSYSSEDSFFFLETKAGSQEHEDIITGLDITHDGSKVITSSYDRTVVVLDVNTLRLEERLSDIHNDIISNVASNRKNSNIIATSANDGIAASWDLRTPERFTASKFNFYFFSLVSGKKYSSENINYYKLKTFAFFHEQMRYIPLIKRNFLVMSSTTS